MSSAKEMSHVGDRGAGLSHSQVGVTLWEEVVFTGQD